MSDPEKALKRTPPKGGRKGGTTFPRVGLKKALEYSDKLVRKTHTGPQPESAVLRGVFDNAGPEGGVRASALKQYGLLEAGADGFNASLLAKNIAAAPPEEQNGLLQRAFLNPKLFKQIYDTHHGDKISAAKIRQTALGLKVHPDSADESVELFMESAETARLGARDGDNIALVQATTRTDAEATPSEATPAEPTQEGEAKREPHAVASATPAPTTNEKGDHTDDATARAGKTGLTVSINVDSSSDPEKLQKQLELLRKYGVI